MAWIELHGATEDWSSGEREYRERGKIYINPDRTDAFYDHTVLATGNKIRVMETAEEIKQCLTCEE